MGARPCSVSGSRATLRGGASGEARCISSPRSAGARFARRPVGDHGIAYALTGAAAGSFVAPFVTAIPVVEVWVQATAASEELCEAVEVDAAG